MEKQISFSEGLVSQPYSDVSPDGQLSTMHNLEVHAGGVRPSLLLGKQFGLGGVLKYIHKTGEYTHYLYLASKDNPEHQDIKRGTLCYYSNNMGEEEVGVVLDRVKAQELTHITHNGHILILSCKNKELQYVLWDNNHYNYLGFIPDLDIQFGLVLEEADARPYINHCTVEEWSGMGLDERFEFYKSCIGDWLTERHKFFVLPFFVRAAYRLYDGSYIKLTPPVLMVPNSNGPFITYDEREIQHETCIAFNVHSFIASLEYFANNIPRNWNKVITDVCIFVSQLNSFNYDYDAEDRYHQNLVTVTENYGYGRTDSTLTFEKKAFSTIGSPAFTLHLLNDLDVKSKIDTAVFKEFARIPIVKLKNNDVLAFDVNKDLEIIETSGNVLYDNDNGIDTIIPNGLFTFNKRLNIYNLDIKEFVSDKVEKSLQKLTEISETCNVYARLQRYGTETEVVLIQSGVDYSRLSEIYYYYVHHRNAISLIIEKEVEGVLKYDELLLEKCLGLNGSYYYNKDGYVPSFNSVVDYTISEISKEKYGNYLYTSKDNNPFIFPLKGRNSVGGGTIIGLNTATKPLSEGQVGDFPLIVFCDDGNYALSIIRSGEDAGLYETVTPVRPDIAVNRNIEATEEGILFVSNQGLMLMGRNESTLLSKKIDGVNDNFGQDIDSEATADAREHIIEEQEYTEYAEIGNDTEFEEIVNDTETADTTEQTGSISYISESSLQGDWVVICSANLTRGYLYKLILSCDTLQTVGRGGDYYISIKEGDNIILQSHIIHKYLETEWVSTISGENENISIKLAFTASGPGLRSEHIVNYQFIQRTDDPDEGDEPVIPGDDDDSEEYYDEGFDTITKQQFEDFTAREYIEICKPLLDYTNKRIFLAADGFNKGFVLNYDNGTFGTIDFGKCVRTSINSYPYGYIQFEDNTVVAFDDDYNFGESLHENGLIVTRPMKMDTLRLKRINEFALHGNFAGKQKLTIYGSNDLKNWHQVGVTKRRHVGMMPGYFFKFWRFKIETSLKENENISGIEVRYNIKNNGMR